MTPEERAEKIYKMVINVPQQSYTVPLIAAEIRAAVEESHFTCCHMEINEVSKRQGKAEAYEDAAKICIDGQGTSCPDCGDSLLIEVAESIRARAKELK